MKNLLRLKLCLVACLFFNFANATNWITIYETGFEANEDLSAWHLEVADLWNDMDPQGSYRDWFFIGEAVSSSGERALYISQDNGVNNVATSTPSDAMLSSAADLQITLLPGNYKMSFDYKLPHQGQILMFGAAGDRDFESYYVDIVRFRELTTTGEWTSVEVLFTVTEETNWINFWFSFRSPQTGIITSEAFAIDNIVIKKEDTRSQNERGIATFKSFLEQPSAVEGETNGERLGLPAVLSDDLAWLETLICEGFVRLGMCNGNIAIREINMPGRGLAGVLDISDLECLEKADFQSNSLTGIAINENLQHLALNQNNIKLSSLPLPTTEGIPFGQQFPLGHNQNLRLEVNEIFDLSSEFVIHGVQSEFVVFNTNLQEGVDYTLEQGLFTVINPLLTEGFIVLSIRNEALGATTGAFYLIIVTEDTTTSTAQTPAKTDSGIIVFPNPASDNVTVVLPENGTSEISIFSLNGALLKTVQAEGAEVELSVASLPTGSYIVVVQQGENRYTERVIIK